MNKLIGFGIGFAMGIGIGMASDSSIYSAFGVGLIGGGLISGIVGFAQWVEEE